MKHIGNLHPAAGSVHHDKRIGRGPGSGYGGTATRGNKGAQARRNWKSKVGFQGGQMPLHRQLPKFGFTNRFRTEYQTVNLETIQLLADKNLLPDNKVDFDLLRELNVIKKINEPLKILGQGELKQALEISADKFSESAKTKIESVGGKVTVNE